MTEIKLPRVKVFEYWLEIKKLHRVHTDIVNQLFKRTCADNDICIKDKHEENIKGCLKLVSSQVFYFQRVYKLFMQLQER